LYHPAVIEELTVCTTLSEGWVRDCSSSSCSLKYMKALVDTKTRDVTHLAVIMCDSIRHMPENDTIGICNISLPTALALQYNSH
jgi:hypothetical protein